MPRRQDIHKILLLGSGPIVIGQACEFDYSGTQACKALREEGYEVVLINSNPATIMTDPETADRTYVEPLTPEIAAKVIEKERPDALLPTMGGQTALNLAVALAKDGTLEKFGVELIGAKLEAIEMAEDRDLFRQAMERIGVPMCPSGIAKTLEEAKQVAERIGSFPLITRPAFTLGGTGGGIAYNQEELEELVLAGLDASPISQILIDRSLLGWKEYELEVMRDLADNVVIICSIENLDPMGIHTGDSITVAPAQTLTDKEYQRLRDASIRIIREIGVETGGSNIQFSVNPTNGDFIVIEMNPRVSRSSALASKATGFPIAKFAAKLAVGYTLDEIPNDITKKTACQFRADDRLRGDESAALCLREILRFEAGADDADAIGGRSDGDRTYLCRVVAEGLAIARNRAGGLGVRSCGDAAELEPDSRQPADAQSGADFHAAAGAAFGNERRGNLRTDGHRSLVSGQDAGNLGDGEAAEAIAPLRNSAGSSFGK